MSKEKRKAERPGVGYQTVINETLLHRTRSDAPMEAEDRPVHVPNDLDQDKLAEAVLGILSLTLHEERRVWKSLDWSLTNLLFEKGWIHDPVSKAKSIVLTEEGVRLADHFLRKHFGKD